MPRRTEDFKVQAGAETSSQENETRKWRSSPKQMFVRFFSAFLVFMCEHDALRWACWCVAPPRACFGDVSVVLFPDSVQGSLAVQFRLAWAALGC